MTPKYLQTDRPGLVKDPTTGALLNVNNAGLEAYKKQKAKAAADTDRITRLENKVDSLTDLLEQLVNKK